ncbi:MAG: hypothetical protein LBQ88_17335 [Treponema sp.]|jgi:hypothetical protein|nr:hypothetical protein [Treponema sp.]
MKIIVKNRQIPDRAPEARKVPHSRPYLNRYGAWGYVEKVYSGDHSADVFLDIGTYLKRCPVSSGEWVVPGEEYTSGERNLPPVGARVFVLMPYGNITYDGCFVLCSGFIVTDKPEKEAFMEDEKEKSRKRVKPGNWKELYDYTTGTHEIVSPDEKTSMKIDYGAGEEKKEKPELHVTLFEKTKLDIIDGDSANLSIFDGEVKVEHKKGYNAKVTVFDTEFTIKEGEVTMHPKKTAVEVDGDLTFKTNGEGKFMSESGLLEIGNAIGVLGTMIAEFIDGVSNAVTIGSPATHTMNPATKTALATLKAKWNQVFS